jgi:DNA-binding transcriptional ArsR family regulator/uncharacterized protein YndB with AHSA1/START domain
MTAEAAFKALAEPRRMELLQILRDNGELSVGELAECVSVTQQAVSLHLKVLETAGLVQTRRDGTRHLYAVRKDGFRATKQFLDGFLVRASQAKEPQRKEPQKSQGSRKAEEPTEHLQQEVFVAANPEQVFDYFVTPELLVQWMGDEAQLEPQRGGLFAVDINDVFIRGKYIRIKRPSLLEISWGQGGNAAMPPGATRVVFSLRPEKGGTILSLDHFGLAPEEATKHAIGWPHFLARLCIIASSRNPGRDTKARSLLK